MKVTGLNIHPLKSGRAVPQTAVTVNLDGLAGDRRFMVVEPEASSSPSASCRRWLRSKRRTSMAAFT